ncbi:uncharacterized protein [Penaeus vannamei]|uniref:uncharacterized protein n=1 Tax=Penaeus vannamei TaxID=6689 RepID=UPI00387F4FE8
MTAVDERIILYHVQVCEHDMKGRETASMCNIPAALLKTGGYQRLEQSGFNLGKSTIVCILALRVIVKRCREFGCGLLVAFINLKKAFYMVHRKSLWEILRLWIIGLIASLHTGTESAVNCGEGLSNFFPVTQELGKAVSLHQHF